MIRSLVLAGALGLVIAVAPVAAVDDAGENGRAHTGRTAKGKPENRREKRIRPHENRGEHQKDRTEDRLERMRVREQGMEDDE